MNSPMRDPKFTYRVIGVTLSLLFLIATLPVPTRAALLRGQLIRIYPNGARGPVPGITVTVFRSDIGRSSPSITDGNGMYYLQVPPGQYWLEVWVSNPPRAYQITVFEPNTDIPPIAI